MRYGWRPDLPDVRDFKYGAVHKPTAPPALPAKVSLRAKMPPVFDQGELGSCTGNALAGALGFIHAGFIASRLFIYYGERVIEHDVRADNGAEIRDGVKVLATKGAPPEADWPYDIAKFAKRPVSKAYKDALPQKVTSYSRLTAADYRTCLADGHPFVIGFSVYDNFESDAVAKTGVVGMPSGQMLGGHAVCVIGYDRHGPAGDCYEVRNSWGDAWGDHGNFWIPAAYLENADLADDAWTLRL
jgi:C1A family cysteine protease